MSDRSEDRLPQELAEVGELLRESRTRPSALELDEIKLHAKARARRRLGSPGLQRGVSVRSRSVTLVLALLLIGGTTAGGIAGSNGNSGSGSAANAQYRPPKCTQNNRKCECPKGYSLTVVNGQIVCSKNAGGGGGGHGDDDDNGHGGHGHHHHKNWRQHSNGHWQWCDDGRNWSNWNGRDDDW